MRLRFMKIGHMQDKVVPNVGDLDSVNSSGRISLHVYLSWWPQSFPS